MQRWKEFSPAVGLSVQVGQEEPRDGFQGQGLWVHAQPELVRAVELVRGMWGTACNRGCVFGVGSVCKCGSSGGTSKSHLCP